MAGRLLPTAEIKQIGSHSLRWLAGHFQTLFAGGRPVATLPLNGNDILLGQIPAARIDKLGPNTLITNIPNEPTSVPGATFFIGSNLIQANGTFVTADQGKVIKSTIIPGGTAVITDTVGSNFARMSKLALATGTATLVIERGGEGTKTLLELVIAAIQGGFDIVAKINSAAYATLINGARIADASIHPNALRSLSPLTHVIQVGAGGAIQSADFELGSWTTGLRGVGFSLGPFTKQITGATLLEVYIRAHSIRMQGEGFFVNSLGSLVVGSYIGMPNRVVGINYAGQLYAGNQSYAGAAFQVDQFGNIFVTDNLFSKSSIDLGAIDWLVPDPVFAINGGEFEGNFPITSPIRNAYIYATTNGVDPRTDPINLFHTLNTMTAVIAPPVGGTLTVKAACYKLGHWSNVVTRVFTKPDNPPAGGATAPGPVFAPVSGNYAPSNGQIMVSITDPLAGATIRYFTGTTVAGTTNPTDTTGTIYTGPFPLLTGTRVVKARATKSGYLGSVITVAYYTIRTGSGDDDTGGTTGEGGNPLPEGTNVP